MCGRPVVCGEEVPYCLSSVQHFQSKNLRNRKVVSSSTWIHNQEKLTQFKEDTLEECDRGTPETWEYEERGGK